MNSTLTDLLTEEADALSSFDLSTLTGNILFRGFLILVVGALAIPVILRCFNQLLSKSKQLHFIQTYLMSSARVGLWFILLLIVADSIGIPVNSIFALMGVAGLALSLALQNTLSNLAGGLQVLLSKPFEVGDFIDTDQGSGTVSGIALAYTKLSTIDNKEILIPNHLVAASKIINHTASGVRRVDLSFSVSYDASTQSVKDALFDACKRVDHIHLDPPPVVYLTAFNESSLSFSLRVWTLAEHYWEVHFALLEEARESFTRHQVEIPYNHLNVHLKHLPETAQTSSADSSPDSSTAS